MNKEILIKKLFELVEPIVSGKGYELYHMEYVKESNEYYLRIYIDKPEGISLKDCEEVSRAVSDMMDVEDPIEEAYYLEVSSPGIERELYTDKHLSRYENHEVIVRLSSVLNGKRKLEGSLGQFNENVVEVDVEGTRISIPRETIKTINLKGDF